MYIYLILINIVSGIIFYSDKQKAKKKQRRIPEKTLHILEFLGGVFTILFLMYSIRHKNAKKSYYTKTYIALLFWIILIILI